MEEISGEDKNINLVAVVRRLATQVEQLQNTINRQSGNIPTIRTRLSLDDGEGSGDEGSETNRNVKPRHGIRADAFKIFKFDGSDYHLWEFSMMRYLKQQHIVVHA